MLFRSTRIFLDEEVDKLIDGDEAIRIGVARAEQSGIVFLDEIDKICGGEEGRGPDVSRRGPLCIPVYGALLLHVGSASQPRLRWAFCGAQDAEPKRSAGNAMSTRVLAGTKSLATLSAWIRDIEPASRDSGQAVRCTDMRLAGRYQVRGALCGDVSSVRAFICIPAYRLGLRIPGEASVRSGRDTRDTSRSFNAAGPAICWAIQRR